VNTIDVTVARIYLTEQQTHLPKLLRKLQEVEQVRGVTVLRGIAGFGPKGRLHAAGLVDLSLDLPLVIEFFDEPTKVARVLADLAPEIPPGHLLTWSAQMAV